ncbi:uncharacterized protein F5Z01DRAFT_681129 [Emericellopsis atlantica]|uniref:Zn(2)-C6 fungal-type domain-containing protein n=1 Tax=Emericellopsis atlantica TaxID=2614577 RepID=A0A9P7ZNR1_9HYPO|nr:uncharacterized protein F5Z01DRAFT_681129 [Emericellopsis atlantica]KAG9255082.1 hypothetical protein F5Z01DRAFT_681129 [Emericellopsis atlantica]
MYSITSASENTKTANQAWRKRPRKFAPKSRRGCKTCKIRRVKCDLARPSCLKCHSTGRTCDGYDETTLTVHTASAESDYQPRQRHITSPDSIAKVLGPLIILPVTGTAQAGAMCFFEHAAIKHLSKYQPGDSWQKTLMFFSQTVPSVRHAAMALALLHRRHTHRDSGQPSQPSQSWLPDEAALFHYNRAIQLLLHGEGGNSIQTTATTLLVCYLFACFDHLACSYVQAIKHLRAGVELSCNIDKASTNTLIFQATKQIRRLDMQAVMFLIDWTPVGVEEQFMSTLTPCDGAFVSLEQAADHMQILVSRVMSLRNTKQEMMDQAPQSNSCKENIFQQLNIWLGLFEYMLQQNDTHGADADSNPLISLLRMHYIMAWSLLSTAGSGRELDYDEFLPQFQQCLTLADDVAAAHERCSGSSQPTFTPEVGIVPVLYMIGVKCRHPIVRREAVSILRRRPIREAVWDSISAARVVGRVIEIEEGGMVRSMSQIPLWQRVETVSWMHVVSGQSAGTLDMKYTFCAQEGTFAESLVV